MLNRIKLLNQNRPKTQCTHTVNLCCAELLSPGQLLTPWTVARQAPLSMRILQARILEWVATPFFRASSQPWDQTQVSRIAGGYFTSWVTREAEGYPRGLPCPPPGDHPIPGIEPRSPALQVDSLPSEPLTIIFLPLNSRIIHDLPTSCPAPLYTFEGKNKND